MPSVRTSVVVHGHFYQPPREDPRTDRVPADPGAAPAHDWNRRVHDECYAPLTAASVLDAAGRITQVVNTLEWMSFDAGPTLLRWMAREAPETYRAFLEADARSVRRLGHGNAVAAPYHHVILPLRPRSEKVTEVRWGIADFERRFGRSPDGFWLPETAVDTETLDVLAREGIRFTVLAPSQVKRAPRGGMPGRVSLPGGRSIAVFVYDGGLSHDVAFGHLLSDAEAWRNRIVSEAGGKRRLVSLATDAETFGHHHRWGDMALAAVLTALERTPSLRLESFASFLARNPPRTEVKLVEPSSWSCAHGVDRWRRACGCRAAPERESQQAWREVLFDALTELSGRLHALFESEGSELLADPRAARDAFGTALDGGPRALRDYLAAHAARDLSDRQVERALQLLEMERHTLGAFTSCGWFFDDVGGPEPVQNLRYAARALDLAGAVAAPWEAELVLALAEAPSNDPRVGDAARLWRERVRGDAPAPRPVGATVETAPPRDAGEVAAARELVRVVRRLARSSDPDTARRVPDLVARAGEAAADALPEARRAFVRGRPWSGPTPSPELRAAARSLGFAETFFSHSAPGGDPLALVLGVHLHQPVGNFDEVFRSHSDEVYLPLLDTVAERGLLPFTLHVSGPLLDWLEAHAHPLLDRIGALASSGGLELLASGLYEPVLPALGRTDRREQIGWMRERLRARFGVEAKGLWLTERVWEPDLVHDLTLEGVRHVLVDDRHFLVSGFERDRLFRPYHTQGEGGPLALLPIDERLRYLVPFRPPEEIEEYLTELRARGRRLAVLVDDGEKFGGWPGTAEWVWGSGWLERFLTSIDALRERGAVELMTAEQAATCVPSGGVARLPTASYHEMEGWALPPAASARYERLDTRIREEGLDEEARNQVRGGHWLNFLARYGESARMHRKATALSELCRARGDPEDARRAIGRAQCNDAYWHGVFGGLYLAHLRGAVWASLAEAERRLRAGEGLLAETVETEAGPEILIHSESLSAAVSLSRGGAIVELTDLEGGVNLADTLTRRREAYHRREPDSHESDDAPDGGMPSIHDLEESLALGTLPPFDREERAILVDRVLAAGTEKGTYAEARYDALSSWAAEAARADVAADPGGVTLSLRMGGAVPLHKTLAFRPDGTVEARYRWDPVGLPPDALFAPELSLRSDVALELDPEPVDLWRYEIRTVSKSERGAEETLQGISLTPLWRCSGGEARLGFRIRDRGALTARSS